MNTLELTEENILDVWSWCSEAYLQHGIRLKLPANTNHTKTYQWRYLRSIAIKFQEWQFDEQTSKQFIKIALRHCNKSGVLKKGLAALHQKNLLQICYDELRKQTNNTDQSMESLIFINDWLSKKGSTNLVKLLLHRRYPDEYCNITKWYNAAKISKLYLALSKSCGIALYKLAKTNIEERSVLPKSTTLYLVRTEFLEQLGSSDKIRQILGKEWREL